MYIIAIECKNRWLRLRQRFSKERQLREQETRSGSKKPTRQKWMLFDSLTFLERHITQRRLSSFNSANKLAKSPYCSRRVLMGRTHHRLFLQRLDFFAFHAEYNARLATCIAQRNNIMFSSSIVNNLQKGCQRKSYYTNKTTYSTELYLYRIILQNLYMYTYI